MFKGFLSWLSKSWRRDLGSILSYPRALFVDGGIGQFDPTLLDNGLCIDSLLSVCVGAKTPMADPITPEVSTRICQHMNDDHADAVALYAQVYGQAPAGVSAQMQSIDPEGMDLVTQLDGESASLRIPFDRPLQDSEDAHHTLIEMVKRARAQLKAKDKAH